MEAVVRRGAIISLAALLLVSCAVGRPSELSLRNCGVSAAIEPDTQTGLREPPEEITGHVNCRF